MRQVSPAAREETVKMRLLLPCTLLAACASATRSVTPNEALPASPQASFTKVDAAFNASPRGEPPLVVLDDRELAKAPPFKAVGVLQLVGKETKQLTAFYDTAVAAGQAAGCDVLYQRDAFELGTRIPKARIPGSDGGIGRFIASSGREWHRSDELVWQFLCGVTGATGGEQEETLKQATFVAIELRRKALGNYEPCEPYVPLGSHVIRRDVCANDLKNYLASSSGVHTAE
jgi:hypothetical protein